MSLGLVYFEVKYLWIISVPMPSTRDKPKHSFPLSEKYCIPNQLALWRIVTTQLYKSTLATCDVIQPKSPPRYERAIAMQQQVYRPR